MRLALALLIASVVAAPAVQGQRATAPSRATPARGASLPIAVVDAPRGWIEPHHEGNRAEGKLYFGVVLENRASGPLLVGARFRSYAPDGTELTGCSAPGGEGPGVTEVVPSGGRVMLVCQRSTVPLASGEGLRVTARYTARPVRRRPVRSAEVTATELAPEQQRFADGAVRINGYARIHATTRDDAEVKVRLRFVTADGLQVASCDSRTVRLDPDADVRVDCGAHGVLLDPGVPRPTRVVAELYDPSA